MKFNTGDIVYWKNSKHPSKLVKIVDKYKLSGDSGRISWYGYQLLAKNLNPIHKEPFHNGWDFNDTLEKDGILYNSYVKILYLD